MRTLGDINAPLREEVSCETVRADLIDAVQPAHVSVRLRYRP
jgi:hypothetical protein